MMTHKKKKIISIVGARPQFIKLAPLSKALNKYHDFKLIHTGQHYDRSMSGSFFEQLDIENPTYNLGIKSILQGEQTGRMIIGIEKIILKEKPELLIIFGDTNSTLAGSVVGSKLNIPIIHIEAGLRSFNNNMPEEINRIISDHISNFLFAPTKTAQNNLRKEGLKNKTYMTGDIMVDCLNKFIPLANRDSKIKNRIDLGKEYYLLTLHRPYNVDDSTRLNTILNQIGKLNRIIIFPVHPRTRNIIDNNKLQISNQIKMIEPASYLDFIYLENNAKKILTDSGGIQKEAYLLKKPCLTIRTETEWVETIEDGWNLLVNPEDKNFVEKIISFQPENTQTNIFGENVSNKMLDIINTI